MDCPAIDWNHEKHPRGAMRANKAMYITVRGADFLKGLSLSAAVLFIIW